MLEYSVEFIIFSVNILVVKKNKKEDGNKSRQFTISFLRYIDIMTIIYLLKSRICFHYISISSSSCKSIFSVISLFWFSVFCRTFFCIFFLSFFLCLFLKFSYICSVPSKHNILCNFPLNFTNQKNSFI